jgi:hypothetical protein
MYLCGSALAPFLAKQIIVSIEQSNVSMVGTFVIEKEAVERDFSFRLLERHERWNFRCIEARKSKTKYSIIKISIEQ